MSPIGESDDGAGSLALSVATSDVPDKPSFTPDQVAVQLTTSWGVGENYTVKWQPGTVYYSFDNQDYPTSSSPEQAGFVAMSPVEQAWGEYAFQSWQDLVAGITLTSAPAGTAADISFNYSSKTTDDGSYTDFSYRTYFGGANYMTDAKIWLASDWTSHDQDSDFYYGSYGLITFLHEIGHSIGLSHPGNYDASQGDTTYAADAVFAEDNRQYTVMSYFGGYAPGQGWQQDGTYNRWDYSETPMVLDIYAIQQKYGANYSTRSGDTVYGFHSNLTDLTGQVFNMADNPLPIYSVWDGGGDDTFDWSGYGGDQTIDLTPGHYSSVDGLTDNVGIAYGAIIEDAIGGAGNDSLIGNDANNVLTGGAGNDTLDGGLGADTLIGGTGNDTYSVDNLGDVVVENPGEGIDTLVTTLDVFALDPNIEYLNITGTAIYAIGNSASNVIAGDGEANYIDGVAGPGPDTLIGGDGNDWYVVHNAADLIVETPSGGAGDFVTTDISYALPDNVEQLWLQGAADLTGTGNSGDNGLVANSGNDTLDGGAGNDWLVAGPGADTLLGGAGADTLIGGDGPSTLAGGAGNDVYVITQDNHLVMENPGEGVDAVAAYLDYALPANVEQLWLQGSADMNGVGNSGDNGLVANAGNDVLDAQSGNDWLVGGSGNDTLIGGAGNDTLVAGSGVDTLIGGTGNDAYVVNNASDVITENANEGNDSVASTVAFTLPANVENLFFSQNQSDLNGTGNGLDNILYGNNGNNVLNGLAGNDTLIPWGGNDTLTGGSGNDLFVFHPGMGHDVITDFVAGGTDDSLDLTALGAAGVTWTLAQSGANTVFAFSDGGQLTLDAVNPANLLHPSADYYA